MSCTVCLLKWSHLPFSYLAVFGQVKVIHMWVKVNKAGYFLLNLQSSLAEAVEKARIAAEVNTELESKNKDLNEAVNTLFDTAQNLEKLYTQTTRDYDMQTLVSK